MTASLNCGGSRASSRPRLGVTQTEEATMRTYTVLFAEDVPHYGTAEIHAASDEAAQLGRLARPVGEQAWALASSLSA